MNNQLKRRNSDDVRCCYGPPGPRGLKGDPGNPGATGPAGVNGSGYAEFVQLTQGSNSSVPNNTAFMISNEVINTLGITQNAAPRHGTSFFVPIGTYVIDFETIPDFAEGGRPLSNYISMCISTSPDNLIYTLDDNSLTTTYAESWMQGRHIINFLTPMYLTVCSVAAGNIKVIDGDTGDFVVRITFLKIA
ncbi:MAG: hypothetical protein Terrestrivirus1_80 [Terrestrivirus sp.]|uniref:Collagen-like protein n=1 Tax=Terrestrivirus sp. TaxID=2487775 RepID=A0A3G4ZK49_9VIRU|nr:MAG: hypothetical protein Terrestrivirus1_80 [Terrestrivirus sp.]